MAVDVGIPENPARIAYPDDVVLLPLRGNSTWPDWDAHTIASLIEAGAAALEAGPVAATDAVEQISRKGYGELGREVAAFIRMECERVENARLHVFARHRKAIISARRKAKKRTTKKAS